MSLNSGVESDCKRDVCGFDSHRAVFSSATQTQCLENWAVRGKRSVLNIGSC